MAAEDLKQKTAEDLLAASARGWRGEKRKKTFSFSRSTLVLALRAYSRVLFDFWKEKENIVCVQASP